MAKGRPKGTIKTGGRVKGQPNAVTTELRERIKQFLEATFEDAVDAYKKCDPDKRVMLYEKFLAYVVPKQSATEAKVELTGELPAIVTVTFESDPEKDK